MVAEFDFGELATLKDGRHFDVYPFDANHDIQAAIAAKTEDFWARVQAGRSLTTQIYEAERTFKPAAAQSLRAQLQLIEPEPDGSDAYASYLKERFNIDAGGEVKADYILYDTALEHKKAAEGIKYLSQGKQLHESVLKRAIGDHRRLVFPNGSYASWAADANGIRRFLNKVK